MRERNNLNFQQSKGDKHESDDTLVTRCDFFWREMKGVK